ncbi:hypothetical protein [Nocardioides sp. TF02-7]|uniref:hypothetical protein n=1 Tax=Nocardioides sp. TF02-7 TaxID=2917724 RepID=UPI001F070EE7|nr:hypothetical protein [Nocardioides sp. TF02-7]UMG91760.1 hypothetical protein MF408_17080 [Nocardioides sp. TF02-7]
MYQDAGPALLPSYPFVTPPTGGLVSALRRINDALPSASMLVAVLALVVAAAGAGYAAGKIGTKDLKNNAVTSAKVKNGSLKATDLVREGKFKYVGKSGAPAFRTGGEGDCVWQLGSSLVPGLGRPGFRKDRFGTVHLAGVAAPADGGGGDGVCDSGAVGETEDAVAFVLPGPFRPARTQLLPIGTTGGILVVGRNGLAAPGLSLPPGAVAALGTGSPLILDGISYLPAGSKLVAGRTADRLSPQGRRLLERLGAA